MKQLLFFALKKDMLALLEVVESKGPLTYIRIGNYPQGETECEVPVFDSGELIPNLGIATADSATACEAFLVCKSDTPIHFRVLPTNTGNRICVDQLANPDSVELKPGGIWCDDVVLHGRVASASDSKISQELMKRFQVGIRSRFSKMKAFYVGPLARALFDSGKRLTISAQSPREFDLTADK